MKINSIIDDLKVFEWDSLFVLGNQLGTTNFILQYLNDSFGLAEDQDPYFSQIFGLSKRVLYVKKDNLTEPELRKYKEFNRANDLDFFDYNESKIELLIKTIESHSFSFVIFDDVKSLYNHKKFNSLVESIKEKRSKLICGFFSTEEILRASKFLIHMDILLHVDVKLSEGNYEITLENLNRNSIINKPKFYILPLK